MRYILKPIGRLFLKHVFADFVAMEAIVRASGLDWTIVRPSRLTDQPLSGHYRTRRELDLRRNFTVARADVAHFVLAVTADPDTYGATFSIAK
jgi:uncharacterized protein YbjT (DUF2867 family)